MNDWAEFRHFKYLLAILEYQGFRAASEHLHTAEPNLSVQAKQFQENFGIRLLEKTSSGRIKLTPTGIAFKPIARNLLKARDEAIAALIAVECGEIDSLRFGCASSINRDLFRTAPELHREIVPKCSIRPVLGGTNQLVEELLSGTLDAAIVTSMVDDERLHVEEIRRDRLLVCVRKDHALGSKGIYLAGPRNKQDPYRLLTQEIWIDVPSRSDFSCCNERKVQRKGANREPRLRRVHLGKNPEPTRMNLVAKRRRFL
jgi:DNA-binding transcriptional LysR family regulator